MQPQIIIHSFFDGKYFVHIEPNDAAITFSSPEFHSGDLHGLFDDIDLAYSLANRIKKHNPKFPIILKMRWSQTEDQVWIHQGPMLFHKALGRPEKK